MCVCVRVCFSAFRLPCIPQHPSKTQSKLLPLSQSHSKSRQKNKTPSKSPTSATTRLHFSAPPPPPKRRLFHFQVMKVISKGRVLKDEEMLVSVGLNTGDVVHIAKGMTPPAPVSSTGMEVQLKGPGLDTQLEEGRQSIGMARGFSLGFFGGSGDCFHQPLVRGFPIHSSYSSWPKQPGIALDEPTRPERGGHRSNKST